MGVWSARELVAHMGYWAGHAAEAIHLAEQGRLDEFEADVPSVDERNAVVARVAAETDMKTVQAREELAFEAFRKRILTVDPGWLGERDADDDSLEEIIGYDGVDHFREHTNDIRAWFAAEVNPTRQMTKAARALREGRNGSCPLTSVPACRRAARGPRGRELPLPRPRRADHRRRPVRRPPPRAG